MVLLGQEHRPLVSALLAVTGDATMWDPSKRHPEWELSPSRKRGRVSGTPSPSRLRRSVMRLALGTPGAGALYDPAEVRSLTEDGRTSHPTPDLCSPCRRMRSDP